MGLLGRRSRRAPSPVPPVDRLAAVDGECVWPYWLERQLDPGSPAHVAGPAAFEANVGARSWTTIGNLDSPHEATVDPRGLVTPSAGWSLDWWVGAEDRWRLPSREVAVRQHLVEDAPVVETAMRVPSGDVVQRAFTVRDGTDELVVVDIENRSPVPVALVVAVRPYGPAGFAPVSSIDLDGDVVAVDGRVALVLPKAPNRTAAGSLLGGDVVDVVTTGHAGTDGVAARCEHGTATAAFVLPLTHRTSLRFVLPMAGADRRPGPLPSSEQVANGWKLHGERGTRLVLPDERVEAAVAANRRYALLLHDGPAVVAGPVGDGVALAGALGRYGLAAEAAELLVGLVDRQAADGALGPDEADTAAVLIGLAEHLARHPDPVLLEAVTPAVADGAEWILRRHRRGGGHGCDRRSLVGAAAVLAAAGEATAAESARRAAAELEDAAAPAPSSAFGPAFAQLGAGDPRAVAALRAVLDAASPTWTWPPVHGLGDGHDRRAVADLLVFVRDLLVRDADGGVVLLGVVPDAWLGRGVEVHGAPTAAGDVSFGIRWHGNRPALLWERDGGPEAVPLTIPGLDPAWSTTARRGEALLAPVEPPGTPVQLRRTRS